MQVTYQLTQRDFFDSFIAHRNRRPLTKWSFRLLALILFVFVGGGLLLVAVRPNAQTVSNIAPLYGVAALWGILLWGSPWWAARSQFSKQPSAQGPRTILVDTTGVHWRWNGGSSDIEWKTFIRWLECKNQFLLYSSPACFNIVPKRALSPEQLAEFCAVLAQNISAR